MAKTVEVTEEEYARDQALRGTVAKLLANPEAKLLVQKAQKLVDPNARTPELDQQNAIKEPVSAIEKQMSDFLAEQRKEKDERESREKLTRLQSTIDAGMAKLRQQGWTDEGLKAVDKLMTERGITDPEIAAAYHEKTNPPPAPVTPGGSGSWNFMDMPVDGGDADLKRLVETKGESEPLLHKMAIDALNEVRGTSRR